MSKYIPPVCNLCKSILLPMGNHGLGQMFKCSECQRLHKSYDSVHLPDPDIERRDDGRSVNCPWKMKHDWTKKEKDS